MANRYFINIGANWGDTANWSDTSGGTGGFSVPTNVDDVFFDANSGNCTVNASARTALTLNFTGYTNTITMTNNITVSGNITLGAGMGIAGTGQLIVNTTSTLTSNGVTWSAGFTFSGTSQTYTLGDNWTISGALRLSATTACTINSNTIYSSGNLTSTTTATTSGTANIELTGGTWSNSSTGALRNNLTINGTITISGNVYYNTGTLTYTSGTVTVTGSTLIIGASTTLNTGGITWNNVTFSTTSIVVTLLSDINISGTLNNQQNNTFNGLFNINTTGTITAGGSFSGTATLNVLGGSLSTTNPLIACNLTLNGNISILTNFTFNTGTLKYISGNITLPSGHTLSINNTSTIDTNLMVWNNVTLSGGTLTYLSDFNVANLLTTANNIILNGAFNLNLYGGISLNQSVISGAMAINLFGGTWTVLNPTLFQSRIATTTFIRGYVTISGNVWFNGVLTFVSGQLNTSSAVLNLPFAAFFINCDKISFRSIIITAGTIQTFDRFFNGTASYPTRIQCLTAGSTYVVTFQDTTEKIANNVKISGCVLSRPEQLIVNGTNSNKGTNTGIRFINQSPNGLPKNSPPIPTQMTFGIGNISDPTRVIS